MSRATLAWLAVPVLLGLGGPGAAQGTAAGRDLAQSLCARCHAVGGADPSPMPNAIPFRELKTRYPVEHLAESLAEGMIAGHPDMPEVQLPPDSIDSFIAYLRTL
jgi:cytochrome c